MNKQLDYLKVVLLGQLTIEAIDSLRGTTKYRQEVKNVGNRFNKMLEDYVNEDFNTVYNNNEEMTMNVMRKINELINKIATSDIDDLVMIDAVIDKYNENREWFVEHASTDFLKLD
jgi:hypothetical protein